jgi:hypothetical protein
MELMTYRVSRKWGDRRPIVLMPIGDIQYTGKNGSTAIDTLKRCIDRCLKEDGYFVGLGDYTDFASPSNRQRLRSAALYDTAQQVLADKALELIMELYDVALKPTTGRWIGVLEGHHWETLTTGETTDQRLAQMLQAPFLGTSAMVRLQITVNNTRANIVIWAHHGTGGGAKACAPLNKLENISPYWGGVDVFLMAHTTKSPVVPINRVEARWHGREAPELVHRKVYFVSTGGFAKAYTAGTKFGNTPRGGYAEQRMLPPAVLGAPLIKIVPRMSTKTTHTVKKTFWDPDVSVEV